MTTPGATSTADSLALHQADAVVLGAGISGLVAASVLLGQGARSVIVVDSYPAVGGNHLDVRIGPYTFDVGSFIFQDDSPLLEHFPEILGLYEPIEPSWARLNPQGRVTTYPFSISDDLVAAGPVELLRIVASAVVARIDPRPLRNAHDFARHWIGSRFLRRSGLENYMARFCGCPIDQIDLTFAQSRMLWISEHTRLPALARRVRDLLWPPPPVPPVNRQLARPREGFARLYEPIVAGLETRGVTFWLGEPVRAVRKVAPGFEIETAHGVAQAARIVSTVPLDVAAELFGVPLVPLPAVTLVTLFYSFTGRRGFEESILYNFSYDARWKRLTVYSDFYGPAGGRTYFAVEVVADSAGTSVAEAAAEFASHTAANGLFSGDLRLEGSHVLSQAYPIYTGGSADRAHRAVAALKALGVESLGRQGSFRYQPTARVSTQEAEAALRERTGAPEPSDSARRTGADR